MMSACSGSVHALLLFDIAEEFDLEELRRLLCVQPPERSPGFRLPAPSYVRFERPPVIEVAEPIQMATGERAGGRPALLRLWRGEHRNRDALRDGLAGADRAVEPVDRVGRD